MGALRIRPFRFRWVSRSEEPTQTNLKPFPPSARNSVGNGPVRSFR